MLKPRVIIRWLKHASLILIALPEPITTAIGVVLLGITFYVSHALSKVIEKSLLVQARERLTSYFAHFRNFGGGAQAVPAAGRQPEPIRVLKTENGDLKADLRSSILIGLPADRSNSSHHTIDRKSIARYYGLDDSPVARPAASSFPVMPAGPEKRSRAGIAPVSLRRSGNDKGSETGAGVSVHHAMARESLYRRYQPPCVSPVSRPVVGYVRGKNTAAKAAGAGYVPSGVASDAPPVHHAVDMTHLQKRFSPEGRELPLRVYREDFDLTGVFSSF